MATTPTFGWPTPDDTDLVRDGAAAIRALGDAVDATAAAFDADNITQGTLGSERLPAGTIIAVKHVLKTNTFVSSVIGPRGNVAVPDLEITHEVADVNNQLIITAYFGAAASDQGRGNTGIAIAETEGSTTTLIGTGAAAGNRTPVGAGGFVVMPADGGNFVVAMPSVTFVHTPGSGSKTYTVRAVNIQNSNSTLYIGRSESDTDDGFHPRAASALVIQEVKV